MPEQFGQEESDRDSPKANAFPLFSFLSTIDNFDHEAPHVLNAPYPLELSRYLQPETQNAKIKEKR